MKEKLITIAMIVCISLPVVSNAASRSECAIWLCLPFGFSLPGCNSAKSAMIRRTFKGKNPAPSFGSCKVQSEQLPSTDWYAVSKGPAALMGHYVSNTLVIRREKPVIDRVSCNHRPTGPEEPLGCVETIKSLKLFKNGKQMGMTYYRVGGDSDYVELPTTGAIYPANAIPLEVIQLVYPTMQ